MGRGRRSHVKVQRHEIERVFQVHFFLYDRDTLAKTDSAGLIVTTDNRLLYAQHGTVETRKRILAWAVHVMNFLSSPSVKLSFQEPSAVLNKKRERSGQESLPGWYEVFFRKTLQEDTRHRIRQKQWSVSFRIDVRGHVRRYATGPMTGRVGWMRSHQRGLIHSLEKPTQDCREDVAHAYEGTTDVGRGQTENFTGENGQD